MPRQLKPTRVIDPDAIKRLETLTHAQQLHSNEVEQLRLSMIKEARTTRLTMALLPVVWFIIVSFFSGSLWMAGEAFGGEIVPLTEPESNQLQYGTYYELEWTFDPVPGTGLRYVHYPEWSFKYCDLWQSEFDCHWEDVRPSWLDKPDDVPEGVDWYGFGMTTGGLGIGETRSFDFYWETVGPDQTYSWEFTVVPEPTWLGLALPALLLIARRRRG